MRFHVGLSFRLKTLKRFLIPLLLGALAYFGFNGIFDMFNIGLIKVNALVNNNTSYDLTMPDYDTYLSNITCGGETLKSVIDNFIDNFDDTYFDLFIAPPNVSNPNYQTINIYLVNKMSLDDFYVSGNYTSSPYVDDYLEVRFPNIPYTSSYKMYKYQFNTSLSGCENTKFTDMQVYSDLVTAMETGVSSSSYITEWSISRDYSNYTFDDVNNYSISDWYYYSSKPLQYNFAANSKTLNSASTFYKSLYIVDNDTTYTFNNNETLPSYYDIYPPTPQPDEAGFIDYTQLDTIYTNLSVSDFSNYQLSFNFNIPFLDNGIIQTTQDYVDSITFQTYCSGRITQTNYYTYEQFPCSLSSSYTINEYNVAYTFNNLTTTATLTNYDKIYVTLSAFYSTNAISGSISSFKYTYNLGGIFHTSYKGTIYEDLTSLPLNFRLYLSSNNSISEDKVFVKNYNFVNYGLKFIGFSNTSFNQTFVLGSSIIAQATMQALGQEYDTSFIETSVTNSSDTGVMIYQQNSAIPLPKLELFFNSGLVISFNNNNNSNDFYYVDSSGNISHADFIKPEAINDTNTYDIGYYTSYVSNFINGLSTGSLILASYTQEFYNSMPVVFQTFILVMFILACVYFTYLIIKR